MNIFYLHINPKKCARWHVDSHVVKMILETCQLLCTAIHVVCDGSTGVTNDTTLSIANNTTTLYKKTHVNHPSAIWCRKSKENWMWLYNLGMALCREYTFRYEKIHKSQSVLENLKCPDLPDLPFTEPTQAMPNEYKNKSSLKAYRNFYAFGKKHLHFHATRHAWKNRRIPLFIKRRVKSDSKSFDLSKYEI